MTTQRAAHLKFWKYTVNHTVVDVRYGAYFGLNADIAAVKRLTRSDMCSS
jgi:hypothetical protein